MIGLSGSRLVASCPFFWNLARIVFLILCGLLAGESFDTYRSVKDLYLFSGRTTLFTLFSFWAQSNCNLEATAAGLDCSAPLFSKMFVRLRGVFFILRMRFVPDERAEEARRRSDSSSMEICWLGLAYYALVTFEFDCCYLCNLSWLICDLSVYCCYWFPMLTLSLLATLVDDLWSSMARKNGKDLRPAPGFAEFSLPLPGYWLLLSKTWQLTFFSVDLTFKPSLRRLTPGLGVTSFWSMALIWMETFCEYLLVDTLLSSPASYLLR